MRKCEISGLMCEMLKFIGMVRWMVLEGSFVFLCVYFLVLIVFDRIVCVCLISVVLLLVSVSWCEVWWNRVMFSWILRWVIVFDMVVFDKLSVVVVVLNECCLVIVVNMV